ncbi:MAG: TonB-dependent receptor [candidate division WOR-3 bacterium]
MFEPVPSLTLTGSLRQDVNRDFSPALSPAIGLSWQIPEFRVRGSWGRAFRAPTLSDRYWPKSGVRNLRPELSSTLQLGSDLDTYGCTFSLTGFRRETKDLIVWFPDSSGLWRPANIDRSICYGGELGIVASPNERIRLDMNATLLQAQQFRSELVYYDYVTGESRAETRVRPQAHTPAFQLSCLTNYTVNSAVRIGLRLHHRAARLNYYPVYLDDGTILTKVKTLPARAVLDLQTEIRPINSLVMFLEVTNLTDVSYAEQFGNSLTDHDYPMPRRGIAISIRHQL